jgi:nitrous oxidase accessory protein NosD
MPIPHRPRPAASLGLTLVIVAGLATPAPAVTIAVGPGDSLQAAIDIAADGDRVLVAPGTYRGNIDFAGKAISVIGAGHESVICGSGGGPVVTFASGEGPQSILDSFTITDGRAARGGGIYIAASSPTILRNVIAENQASAQGSGVYLEASTARLSNNLVVYNSTAGGDPHAIEVVDAAPRITNNTIVRNDSNGIILRGDSPALVVNNVIALNGSGVRGRGICDFSTGGSARIRYNVFFRNRVAALLTGGADYRRVEGAEILIGAPRLVGNRDGNPPFVGRRRPPRLGSRRMEATSVEALLEGLGIRTEGRRLLARDHGDPHAKFDDLDGSRNDIGFTGGPLAPQP